MLVVVRWLKSEGGQRVNLADFMTIFYLAPARPQNVFVSAEFFPGNLPSSFLDGVGRGTCYLSNYRSRFFSRSPRVFSPSLTQTCETSYRLERRPPDVPLFSGRIPLLYFSRFAGASNLLLYNLRCLDKYARLTQALPSPPVLRTAACAEGPRLPSSYQNFFFLFCLPPPLFELDIQCVKFSPLIISFPQRGAFLSRPS